MKVNQKLYNAILAESGSVRNFIKEHPEIKIGQTQLYKIITGVDCNPTMRTIKSLCIASKADPSEIMLEIYSNLHDSK